MNAYDLFFVATIVVGLAFGALLIFTRRLNQSANRFLGLAVLTITAWMAWVLAIDTRLGQYLAHWSWVPLQYSLTLGPLIYLYVRKLTVLRQKQEY